MSLCSVTAPTKACYQIVNTVTDCLAKRVLIRSKVDTVTAQPSLHDLQVQRITNDSQCVSDSVQFERGLAATCADTADTEQHKNSGPYRYAKGH